ncbi:MAG: outer-membrane lipoprotein carrier protein LolA, partial [Thermodesulfovibrionales bacterium]|nr:outer-membrane lipoprotein carrier protein LolA [Thermodesulfovibrionales bacterium]
VKSRFDESRYGQTPLALINGLTDIKKDFQAKRLADKVILLKPIKSMGNIIDIKLTLDENNTFPISKMVLTDNKEGYIEIIFLEVKVNQGLKDSLLRFNPPSDVTIINQ